MTDKKSNKLCGVCSDKAIGTNFGATTCESCKAFFRRTAVKSKEFKCPFNDMCIITNITRKFCQKCRLKKCYAIGMKKESILNDNQKELKRLKIEENRRKRRKLSNESTNIADSTTTSLSESTILTKISNPNKIIEIFDKFDEKDRVMNTHIMEIRNHISNNSINDISDHIYQKAMEFKFSNIQISRPLTDYRNNFNELEGNRLSELLNALKPVFENPCPRITSEVTEAEELNGHMAIRFEKEIQNFVKLTKGLNAFKEICPNDQLALVKYGCVEILSMRSISYYDLESESWIVYMDENNSAIMKLNIMKPQPMYNAYRNYFRHMGPEWDCDPVILNLITAIWLFNPNHPNIVHTDVVVFQQHVYMYLLQRYLLLKYQSETESKLRFSRLMNALKYVRIIGQTIRGMVTEKEAQDYGPLLKEIFDAKTEN